MDLDYLIFHSSISTVPIATPCHQALFIAYFEGSVILLISL